MGEATRSLPMCEDDRDCAYAPEVAVGDNTGGAEGAPDAAKNDEDDTRATPAPGVGPEVGALPKPAPALEPGLKKPEDEWRGVGVRCAVKAAEAALGAMVPSDPRFACDRVPYEAYLDLEI